ncbi:MAG: hypothetical protein Q7S25_02585 [Candidatus Limnocylindria bacterium]|nr:hypothetical protein [Candidatus Limnocylindria bacterium]
MERLVARDEREAAVDRAADRLSYLVLSFGVLAIVAYRSVARGEASWDLLALVIVGGFAGAAYRTRQRAVSRRWALVVGLTAAIALVLAALMVFTTRV